VAKIIGFVMKFIRPFIGGVAIALIAGAASAEGDFWLSGNYTQNVPCKGDGSDPAELKVQISAQEIESKVGICTFLDTKLDAKSVQARVECKFPAGPLMGEITFTMNPNKTVAFVDSNKTYTATLYRCPK
jgi:hypothetical protein